MASAATTALFNVVGVGPPSSITSCSSFRRCSFQYSNNLQRAGKLWHFHSTNAPFQALPSPSKQASSSVTCSATDKPTSSSSDIRFSLYIGYGYFYRNRVSCRLIDFHVPTPVTLESTDCYINVQKQLQVPLNKGVDTRLWAKNYHYYVLIFCVLITYLCIDLDEDCLCIPI